MTLGKKIAHLRRLKDLTQRDLAERLQIHQSMVTRWEKDQVEPKSTTLERLADALEVPVEELFRETNQATTKARVQIAELENPQLAELLGQVHELDPTDQDALRAVLDAMLTKRRIQAMVGARKSA